MSRSSCGASRRFRNRSSAAPNLGGAKSQPVHAGVDLDPDHEAVRRAGAFEELDLQRIVHDQIEIVRARLPRAARR